MKVMKTKFILIKRLALLALCIKPLFVSSDAAALEAGYSEAQQYFVQRKKALSYQQTPRGPSYSSQSAEYYPPVNEASSSTSVSSNKRSKVFVSLGFEEGNSYFDQTRVLGLGLSINDYKWIQSNLSLEWRSIAGKSGDDVSFMYSVQPSSVLFFLGPEIGFGAGRSWVNGDGEGFTSLKLGVNISNPWVKRYLVGFNVYYRRDQGIRDSFHDDRIGATVRLGF